MIIVDTSVWVDHFRKPDRVLMALIADGDIALHPFVLGELALGGLPIEGAVYEDLLRLDQPPTASPAEAAAFIQWAELSATGIGYVDAHLLVSAKLVAGGSVLTRDKKLRRQAVKLGVAYEL